MAQGKNEVSPVEKSCQHIWRLIAGVHQPRKTRFSPGAFAKSSEAFKFAFVRREKRGFSRLTFTRPEGKNEVSPAERTANDQKTKLPARTAPTAQVRSGII